MAPSERAKFRVLSSRGGHLLQRVCDHLQRYNLGDAEVALVGDQTPSNDDQEEDILLICIHPEEDRQEALEEAIALAKRRGKMIVVIFAEGAIAEDIPDGIEDYGDSCIAGDSLGNLTRFVREGVTSWQDPKSGDERTTSKRKLQTHECA